MRGTSRRMRAARNDRSSRLPMGVATTYRIPRRAALNASVPPIPGIAEIDPDGAIGDLGDQRHAPLVLGPPDLLPDALDHLSGEAFLECLPSPGAHVHQ